MSQTETVDAPTPSRTKAFYRMERIRLANKMTAETKPTSSLSSGVDKKKNKETLNKKRIQEEENRKLANAALIAAGVIPNPEMHSKPNIDNSVTTSIKCLSDTEISNKSGIMYPYLCHIAHYRKMMHIKKRLNVTVAQKMSKKTKNAKTNVSNNNVYQDCYSIGGTIPLLHQKKDLGSNIISNETCRKCLTWFLSQPTHKKMGILSSNTVSYFPQLLKEINRKGGIHKVFCHWDQLQSEYLISLIHKRNVHPFKKSSLSNYNNGNVVLDEMIKCDSSIMKNLRAAEQRCTKALVSILNILNRNERSMTFLPEWLDSKHFLYDISTISHGQFLSKYPSEWIKKEEFWKHNPWERRVEKRQNFINFLFEVDWYSCDNRHTFAELLVHRIELCIWRAWVLERSCKGNVKNKSKKQKLELHLKRIKDKEKCMLDYLHLKEFWHTKLTSKHRANLIQRSKLSNILKPNGNSNNILQYYTRKVGEKYHYSKIRPLYLLLDVLMNCVYQKPTDSPWLLFLPLDKLDMLHDVVASKMANAFLEIVGEIREEDLISDNTLAVMEKRASTGKISKNAKKKKRKKEKKRAKKLLLEFVVEKIICNDVLTKVYKVSEERKAVEEKKKKTKKKNPVGFKKRRASFEDSNTIYFPRASTNMKRIVSDTASDTFAISASLSKNNVNSGVETSRLGLKRRSRSVSRFNTTEDVMAISVNTNRNNTSSSSSGITINSSKKNINNKNRYPKYRNARTQTTNAATTTAIVKAEQQEHQEQENETLRKQLQMLQSKIDILFIEKRDLQAEREVYRYELSAYKEAVSALRASGCVPPKAALLPSQQMTVPNSPLHNVALPINQDGGSITSSTVELEKQLTAEIEAFVRCVRSDADDRLLAFMTALRRCTAAVHSLWPRAQVKVYGSFATGFQLPRSDLDLLITLPQVQRQEVGEAGGTLEGRNAIKETWQQELSRCLKECPWVFHETVQCHGNLLPIITLATRPLGGQGLKGKAYSIRCDISLFQESHNGLQTNRYLQSLTRELTPLTPLVLVMKEFLSQQGFLTSFTGGLSSYGLVLLVSRFLQSIVENDLDGFANYTLGGLLLAFLDHLGNRFDPASTGISVHNRCYLDRLNRRQSYVVESVNGGNGNINAVVPYASDDGRAISECDNGRRHGRVYGFDPHKFDPLHIEDPLLPTNNVGRNCFRINYILRACSTALSKLLNEGPSKIGAAPFELSCLQSMMIVPKTFIEKSADDYQPLVLSADHLAQHNKTTDSHF